MFIIQTGFYNVAKLFLFLITDFASTAFIVCFFGAFKLSHCSCVHRAILFFSPERESSEIMERYFIIVIDDINSKNEIGEGNSSSKSYSKL